MLKSLAVYKMGPKENRKFKRLVWGPIEDTMGRASACHKADLGLILGSPDGSLGPVRSNPEPKVGPKNSWAWYPKQKEGYS